MQTFLPYPSFARSAQVLDNLRLGKQRVEASQVHELLLCGGSAWSRHPAVNMWNGYIDLLALYHNSMIVEWERRGKLNNMMFLDVPNETFEAYNCFITTQAPLPGDLCAFLPPWLGNEELHSSHRAALLYKDENHYGRFAWAERPRIRYKWPA